MKRISILLLFLLLAITAVGCNPHRGEPSSTQDNSSADSDKNPFQASAGVPGCIGHRPANPNVGENGKKLLYTYNGKKVETLSMTVVGVYAPDFIPDMQKTSSYGGYHGNWLVIMPYISKKMPNYQIARFCQNTNSYRALNKQIFGLQYFDGQDVILDNLKIKADGTLYIDFKIVGCPGARYQNTIYVNHKMVCFYERPLRSYYKK